MSGPSSVCDALWRVSSPDDQSTLDSVARDAAQHPAAAGMIADVAADVLAELNSAEAAATSGGPSTDSMEQLAHAQEQRDRQRLAVWLLIDKMCKGHDAFVEAFRPRVVTLAVTCAPSAVSQCYQRYQQLVASFRHVFDVAVASLIALRLQERDKAQHQKIADAAADSASASSAPAPGAVAESSSSRALATVTATRFGGFMAQRGNRSRPEGAQHTLQVKTRDSLQAVKVSSMYAPAMAAEITVAMPERDADAPEGFIQALPASHHDEYVDARRKRLRDMSERWKQERDQKDKKRVLEGAARSEEVVDPYADVKMPLELPRDEFGVKVGNFPAGVRFIRDAVRQCGGAVELDRIEARIAQLEDPELRSEFGNIRQFLFIHKPTFAVVEEHSKWIVRLTDDPPPDLTKPYTWFEAVCPLCTKRVGKGWNLARHMNCRKCCGVQMAAGMAGKGEGPIAVLFHCAVGVMQRRHELDDEDIEYFAQCLVDASEVKRFRFASVKLFSPVLKAVRVVRDMWLQAKKATSFASVEVTPEDRAVAHFFHTLARLIRRLPISWLETGDIIDMASRFSTQLLPPHPPAPRSGDVRLLVDNQYPGFLLADSETDDDDLITSSDDEGFSDDEAAQFEFAPPVSPMETVMVAGIERDTKRLNFRLRTAPPMPAAFALKGDGTKSLDQMYRNMGASAPKPV